MELCKLPGLLFRQLRPYWFVLILTSLISGLLFMSLTLFGFENPLMLLAMLFIGLVCIVCMTLYVLLESFDDENPRNIISGFLGFERHAGSRSSDGSRPRSACFFDLGFVLVVLLIALFATCKLTSYLYSVSGSCLLDSM